MMKMSANDRRLVAIIISAVLFIVGFVLLLKMPEGTAAGE